MRRSLLIFAPAFCMFLAVGALPCAANPSGELGEETLKAVMAMMDSARAEGLPAKVLLNKALEGSTKGADDRRIRAAVSALLDRLRVARATLGTEASQTELAAAAEAIYAGVDTSDIRKLSDVNAAWGPASSRESTLSAELVVLTDLISREVPVAAATHVIIGLAEARAGYDEILEFRRAVEQDILSGTIPAQSAFKRAKEIAPLLPPLGQEPARRSGNPR